MRLGLVFVPDRERECGPGRPEGREQEHHRRGDANPDRVQADLGHVGELGEEEAVAEVRDPQEHGGWHERDSKLVHLAEQLTVEVQTELLTAVSQE